MFTARLKVILAKSPGGLLHAQKELGHEAALHDSADLANKIEIGTFVAIIIAASVHQQVHQETIAGFAIAHQDLLNRSPSAFVSVSLSAALDSDHVEAQNYVDRFVLETGWRPAKVLLLPSALRYSGYDYFKQQIIKHVVMKGRGLEDSERDYEFTDWKALSEFVDSFLELAGRTVVSVPRSRRWCEYNANVVGVRANRTNSTPNKTARRSPTAACCANLNFAIKGRRSTYGSCTAMSDGIRPHSAPTHR